MPTPNTGTVFDALSAYTAPAGGAPGGGGLAGEAAGQNLAAAPDLARLSSLVNQINQQANQARIPGGEAMEQQSSQNIANELAGNLPQSFLDTLQTSLAQRGAAGGFGVDSPNMNAAALRAMGLQAQQLQQQGQQDLTSAYNRAAPLWDVSQGMITPALLQQQQDAAAARAIQQQQIQNQASQAAASLAEQQREFGITAEDNRNALAAQMGLSYSQLDERQREFVNSQAQQLQEQQAALAESARVANMQNAYQMAQMQAQIAQQNQQYQLQLQQEQARIAADRYAQQLQNQQFMYATPPAGAGGGFSYPGAAPFAQPAPLGNLFTRPAGPSESMLLAGMGSW